MRILINLFLFLLGISVAQLMKFPEIPPLVDGDLKVLRKSLESIDFSQCYALYVKKSRKIQRNPKYSFQYEKDYVNVCSEFNVVASGFPPDTDVFEIVKWAAQFEKSAHWPSVLPVKSNSTLKCFIISKCGTVCSLEISQELFFVEFWTTQTVVRILRLANEGEVSFNGCNLKIIRYKDADIVLNAQPLSSKALAEFATKRSLLVKFDSPTDVFFLKQYLHQFGVVFLFNTGRKDARADLYYLLFKDPESMQDFRRKRSEKVSNIRITTNSASGQCVNRVVAFSICGQLNQSDQSFERFVSRIKKYNKQKSLVSAN